jgi:hypothetical protein
MSRGRRLSDYTDVGGQYTIDVPGLNEIIVWRSPTDDEVKEVKRRYATRRSPVPKMLQWLPQVIQVLDDTEDLISTAAPWVSLAARRLAPRLVPGLGWVVLAADVANVLTGLLGAPLVGRLPKVKAVQDLKQSISHARRFDARRVFPRGVRGWMGYALEAGQALQTVTGYGLRLGGIMATISDFVWGLYRWVVEGSRFVIRAPIPTDPVGKAWRWLLNGVQYLPAVVAAPINWVHCYLFGGCVALETIKANWDLRPTPERVYGFAFGPVVSWVSKEEALAEFCRLAGLEWKVAPPVGIEYDAPEPWGTMDWFKSQAWLESWVDREFEVSAGSDALTGALASQFFWGILDLWSRVGGEDFEAEGTFSPRERWLLRHLEAGWVPPWRAKRCTVSFYNGRGRRWDYGGWDTTSCRGEGVTAAPVPRTVEPSVSINSELDALEAVFRRSAQIYSGRAREVWYWGPAGIAWQEPVRIKNEPGAPILNPVVMTAFPRWVYGVDCGPFAPLFAWLEIFGQVGLEIYDRADEVPAELEGLVARPRWWLSHDRWLWHRGPAFRADWSRFTRQWSGRLPWYYMPLVGVVPKWWQVRYGVKTGHFDSDVTLYASEFVWDEPEWNPADYWAGGGFAWTQEGPWRYEWEWWGVGRLGAPWPRQYPTQGMS